MDTQQKLNCIVVDDEPLALELISGYVSRTPTLNLAGKFGSAVEAMTFLKENHVDVAFLDIQMPYLTGIEFTKLLPKEIKVIFTTAYDDFALQSYKTGAVDYLLKPVGYTDFLTALDKAAHMIEAENALKSQSEGGEVPVQFGNEISAGLTSGSKDSILIKSDYKMVQIDMNKILYIESMKDYVKIYVEGENHPIISMISMKTLEDQLPVAKFVRVHRSYFVNMQKIEMIERCRIVIGKAYIPISDSFKDSFYETFSHRAIMI